ncbi:ImmA/IrrE family metallo-endopeptidase [Candidatus Parcubacteria bacterium]|nr:ImmA/IrrE family metallo-endopeptidase [Candidatus Parcubacteria bacterium]
MPSTSNTKHAQQILPCNKVNINNLHPYNRVRYDACLNRLIDYYKRWTADVFSSSGLVFPVQTKLIEDYLGGFEFEYIGFKKSDISGVKVDGFFRPDFSTGKVLIFFRKDVCLERQKSTKVHELIHFAQLLDPMFQEYINDIIKHNLFHRDVVYTLIERATEKATAIYLMPYNNFFKKYKEVKSVKEVADYFQVSKQAARIRLQECVQFAY